MADLIADAGEIVEKTMVSLAMQFGATLSERDREDLAQEAYLRVLDRHKAGEEVRSPTAFVKTAARNLTLDGLRRGRFELTEEPDAIPDTARARDPEGSLLARVDLARGIEAAEQLPPAQQAVYRATVIEGLDPGAALRRLGMKRSTFYKHLKLAHAHVQTALIGTDSPYARGEYKLLSAYAFGVASAREAARAERLIRNSPEAAALLRELHRGHQTAAAALPPIAFESADSGILERLALLPGRIREATTSHFPRDSSDASEAATALASSGAGRGAGAASAGVLAKLGALSLGGKAAAGCLATGATVAACVASGLLPAPGGPGDASGEAPRQSASERRVEDPARVEPPEPAGVLPSQLDHPEPSPETNSAPSPSEEPAPEPAPAPAEPAPVETVAPSTPPQEQELGLESAGVPASGSSGSSSTGSGASGSDVRQEFGP